MGAPHWWDAAASGGNALPILLIKMHNLKWYQLWRKGVADSNNEGIFLQRCSQYLLLFLCWAFQVALLSFEIYFKIYVCRIIKLWIFNFLPRRRYVHACPAPDSLIGPIGQTCSIWPNKHEFTSPYHSDMVIDIMRLPLNGTIYSFFVCCCDNNATRLEYWRRASPVCFLLPA